MSGNYYSGYVHCRNRAKMRLGYTLPLIEYLEVCAKVTEGAFEYLGLDRASRNALYMIVLGGCECVAVFNAFTQTIRTILTKEQCHEIAHY